MLILDLDANCGGGTTAIVRNWPGVVHLDVSVNSFDRYDRDPDTRSALDIVTSANDYLSAIGAPVARTGRPVVRRGHLQRGDGSPPGKYGRSSGYHLCDPGRAGAPRVEWARDRHLPVAFTLAGGYLSQSLSQDDLVGLHRLTIATAAMATAGDPLETGSIMAAAYAGPHSGTEGFSFDANGRKSDAGFFDDEEGSLVQAIH